MGWYRKVAKAFLEGLAKACAGEVNGHYHHHQHQEHTEGGRKRRVCRYLGYEIDKPIGQ
jgi:hypothetical protein